MDKRLRQLDLLNIPGHLLRRCHQRSQELFAHCVGEEITRQQAALLIALAKRPGAMQRDLVEATGIDKSTLQEMLGRMVARGWIDRQRSPGNARAWELRITPEGKRLLSDRLDGMLATQELLLAPLPEADRAHFVECMRVLIGVQAARDHARGDA